MRRLAGYFAPGLWMLVIFLVSTDIGSSDNTSRIIGPILRYFFPDVSDATISAVQTVVRKGGHLTEYGILAALFWWARRYQVGGPWRWCWREAWWIVPACALYAVSDEFHQMFVGSRQASVVDVAIDTVGAFLALVAIWAIGRWRRKW